jgi:hypothetical protein
MADMLKNPSKATRFDYDTHDNTPLESPNKGGFKGGVCLFDEGWLAFFITSAMSITII